MQTEELSKWRSDTRAFWDTDSAYDAKYGRILLSPEMEAAPNETALDAEWDRRTVEDVEMLLRGIPIAPEWTCVEIGCGIGRLLKPIALRCRKVIGVDISERMVGFAGDFLAAVDNAEVHLNDGTSLSMIADESVDWVYSHLAFQHITAYEVVDGYLAEIFRVLKPGGYCRIQNWHEAPIPFRERLKNIARACLGREHYHGPRRWEWKPGRNVRFGGVTYHPEDWKRALADHGLRVVSLELGAGHDYWMWTTSRR
ncbi:MAG: class I SAM-dependent methyltransferase [Planctomycetes bacterium]|nr:class I SAM-dependent methyltransferase [Planctomycetota bacterium]